MSTSTKFTHLDKLSRSFAEALFQERPEWLPYAREEQEGDAGRGYLVVEVPDLTRPTWIIR